MYSSVVRRRERRHVLRGCSCGDDFVYNRNFFVAEIIVAYEEVVEAQFFNFESKRNRFLIVVLPAHIRKIVYPESYGISAHVGRAELIVARIFVHVVLFPYHFIGSTRRAHIPKRHNARVVFRDVNVLPYACGFGFVELIR